MSDQQKLKETLSALLDDEAGRSDQLELRRLARALEDNPDLLASYQRYTLVRATLSGKAVDTRAGDFVSAVSSALATEEMEKAAVLASPVATPGFNWLKPLGRVAVAASVAVVVVMIAQQLSPVSELDLPSSTKTAATSAATSVATTTNAAPEQNNRLLNPPVMTVSAGDARSLPQQTRGALPVGCVLDALRADSGSLVWEKPLPPGYVLCKQSDGKQNDSATSCELVSSRIGCYLE